MKAELVKRQDRWDLYGEDGSKIASSAENPFKRLSIKNCQVIEDGYDLDELVDEEFFKFDQEVRIVHRRQLQESLTNMFNKALELLGGKKFSVEDIQKFLDDENPGQYPYIALQLKQRSDEWDVEIVEQFQEEEQTGTDLVWGRMIPKLDKEGCLILKRI